MEQLKASYPSVEDNDTHQTHLRARFLHFPDSWTELRKQKLAYFTYSLVFNSVGPNSNRTLEDLIADGVVAVTPIVYEDFLPASAAGIFQSNLGPRQNSTVNGTGEGGSKAVFEQALGRQTIDHFELYRRMEQDSIDEVVRMTGCSTDS